MTIDEFEATQNGGQPDANIEDVNFNEFPENSDENETVESPVAEETPTDTESKSDDGSDDHSVEQTNLPKAPQTAEENAKFAEERRQRQAEERAKEALEKLKASDPAYQTAKMLEEMYGLPIAQIQEKINQARIASIAEQQNLPVEAVQQLETYKQQLETLQKQTVDTQYQQWQSRIQSESMSVKQLYPMLSDDDIAAATDYMLKTIQNPNIPLQDAVFAVHGAKITQALKDAAKNEVLAEISGRKQAALPPQGGKPAVTNTLTDEEKYVAKMMGISEEDYLKYK